mmetsp:Transcript_10558/g.23776  ORF Transcript_10558/g.23776 Transcript_10558/m.23776 type:complete len:356 (+) Transcript_10558:275-1342(+)
MFFQQLFREAIEVHLMQNNRHNVVQVVRAIGFGVRAARETAMKVGVRVSSGSKVAAWIVHLCPPSCTPEDTGNDCSNAAAVPAHIRVDFRIGGQPLDTKTGVSLLHKGPKVVARPHAHGLLERDDLGEAADPRRQLLSDDQEACQVSRIGRDYQQHKEGPADHKNLPHGGLGLKGGQRREGACSKEERLRTLLNCCPGLDLVVLAATFKAPVDDGREENAAPDRHPDCEGKRAQEGEEDLDQRRVLDAENRDQQWVQVHERKRKPHSVVGPLRFDGCPGQGKIIGFPSPFDPLVVGLPLVPVKRRHDGRRVPVVELSPCSHFFKEFDEKSSCDEPFCLVVSYKLQRCGTAALEDD